MKQKPSGPGEHHPAMKELFDAVGAETFDSIDDLNDFLREHVGGYNDRPQADLGGLSPNRMLQLLAGDWLTSGALRLNPSVTLAELGAARILHDARTLLAFLRDTGPVKLTVAGNLPRSAVAALLPRLQTWSAFPMPDGSAAPAPVNEGDLLWLPVIRHVLTFAKLVTGRARLSVNRRGLTLLDADQAGTLNALLFRTLFQELDLRALDIRQGYVGLQATVAFSFYMLQSRAREWSSPEKLAMEACHPEAVDPVTDWERQNKLDFRCWSFRSRVLAPLLKFGLLEQRELPSTDRWARPVEMRVSPLFDRFLRFKFAG